MKDDMFLISDKVEKLDPKYDLMKDDKQDFGKQEHLELPKTPKYFQKCHIFYFIVIGLVFITFAWMMMSSKHSTQLFNQLEEKTLRVTSKMVQDSQLLMALTEQRLASISEQNKKAAALYVSAIRDTLKKCTNIEIQKANKIVLDKIRDIENELISFSYMIDQDAGSYVEDVGFDIHNIQTRVSTAEPGNASQVLEAALSDVDHEIRSLMTDVDKTFSFYGSHIIQTIEYLMENAINRISIMLNAQQRNCDWCTCDRINMCYNISSQNNLVNKNLDIIVQMVNLVRITTDTVKQVDDIYKEANKISDDKFEKSKNILEKITNDARHTMNSILQNNEVFLGTIVKKFAYEDDVILPKFMIRSMKTVIHSLVRSLQKTMDDFEVVKPVEHRYKLVTEIEAKLDALGNEMKSKASLIADATQRTEYKHKADLDEMKDFLKTRFANITYVVNGIFSNNKNRLTTNVTHKLSYIVKKQLPYISSLALQTYIPTDVCPITLDYQTYVSTAMKEAMDKSDSDIITDKFTFTQYFADDTESGAAMVSFNELDP